MDVKLFVWTLLVISISVYFIPVKNIQKNIKDESLPLVIFEKPHMYTLDSNSLFRIVDGSSAVKYRNRDELFDADITLKNQELDKNFKYENLKADLIVKRDESYELRNNVKYLRDNFVSFNTNELYYNNKNKIAYNNVKFNGIYNKNYVNGRNLHLDGKKDTLRAKDVHFEVLIDKKGK